jgi:Uma2 family endonuclease
VDWGVSGLLPTCPDLAVFADLVRPVDWLSATFHLGGSGGRPVVVIEIVTPISRVNDVVHKVVEYQRAGVPLYIIIDQDGFAQPQKLVVYRYAPEGYRRETLEPHGTVPIPFLGIRLGVGESGPICIDACSGERFLTIAELEAGFRRRHGKGPTP